MSLAFDEYGRPFIILREQEKKKRTKGLEAHKVSQSVSNEANQGMALLGHLWIVASWLAKGSAQMIHLI